MRQTRRRALLLSFLPVVALVGCDQGGRGEDPEEPADPPKDDESEQDGEAMGTTGKSAEETREAAEALLDDAEQALNGLFPDLVWTSEGDSVSATEDGACVHRPAARRADQYLGREKADRTRIDEALAEVLAAHGLPAADPLTGGTGGWLTTSSSGGGLELEFRSKGYAELRVSARSEGDCTG